MTKSKRFLFLLLTLGSLQMLEANAANYGTDLNLTMMPAAGGMAGVGIARPVEPAAAIFGNPATLTQFRDGTMFTFGATYYDPNVEAEHNGGDTGVAWSGKSKAKPYLVPTVAVTQPLGSDFVFGLGLTAIAGVGSDFRGIGGPHPVFATSASLDPNAELIMFGANAAVGYRFTPALAGGIALTIGNGYAQTPLTSSTASVHAFGVRGTAGVTYQIGHTTVGGYYRSPLSMTFRNQTNIGPARFNDFRWEQPQEFAVGIANDALMGGRLLLGLDVIYKDWDNANFYKDFYESQTVIAVGAQLTLGSVKYRAGFSHVNSPIKSDLGNTIGGKPSFGLNGTEIFLTPSLIQYFQATNAEVIWRNQVTIGAGYELTRNFQLDGHAGFALKRDETIGNTRVEASAWQVGLGLTWRF